MPTDKTAEKSIKSTVFEEPIFQTKAHWKILAQKIVPTPVTRGTVGTTRKKNYLRNTPGIAPPILPIILDILPIFFIIVCI